MLKKIVVATVLLQIFQLINSKEVPKELRDNSMKIKNHTGVQKKVLSNGMTVLVRSVHSIPKVSVQLWYNVGSKDEKSGEKGIAHLIEHMIFKGTLGKNSLNLSESDINLTTHLLSGSCNAWTSFDYTGYRFDFPVHNWQYALPIMADCMQHAAFKEDHLSSEMKAVIQELKMRKDNYLVSLAEALITSVFTDHPYHYPIIGYKQDLWTVRSKDLHSFYKKHYLPNNATLVVVGDVQPQEVFDLAEQNFGKIPAQPHYAKEVFYLGRDIISKTVTLYRDIQQPMVMLAYVVPGSTAKKDHVLEITSLILGNGKSSLLYRKLVDELQLVTSLASFTWDLFEHTIFFVTFEPKEMQDTDKIIEIIQQEIDDVVKNGLEPRELERAIKKARMQFFSTLENSQHQAYEIGKYFLATGDENYINVYVDEPSPKLGDEVRTMLERYFKTSIMHKGIMLPLPAQEKGLWTELQKESDALDAKILAARVRTSALEPANYVNKIKVKQAGKFDFPKASTYTLSNGIKVFEYNNDNTAKIDLVLELKAKSYYDDAEKQGLYNFVTEMLAEGTENYTATELAQELETRGMSFAASPGAITMSMLSSDFEKGLELLMEILERPVFDNDEIEKVRIQLLTAIKNFWDSPTSFSGQLIRGSLYKDHPYSKNVLGTAETVAAIDRGDLVDLYEKFISPDGAKLAIVGDLHAYDVKKVLEKTLGKWQGNEVEDIAFPKLAHTSACEVNYPINRDQIVLCFAALSIDRKHPDYDKLLIFDQILGGGVLGSMSSKLFKLREQTGLFYTINGSLIAQANEQPGMVLVKTIVSTDRLKEAEQAIKNTLKTAANTISSQEFEEAKNAIINSLMLNFESNASIAQAFLFLDKYDLPADYFDKRAAMLNHVTIPEMQDAVKRTLKADDLSVFRIGRV